MRNHKKKILIFGDVMMRIVASVAMAYLSEERRYPWLWLPAAALCIETVFFLRAALKDRGVSIVLQMLYEALNPPPDEQLRITLYVPSKIRGDLYPYERYALPSVPPARMRVKRQQGVAGLVYRKGTVKCLPCTGTTFIEQMRELGFTEDEFKKYNERDRASKIVIGVPISNGQGDRPLGVLIVDSTGTATLGPDGKNPGTMGEDAATIIEQHYAPYLALLLTPPRSE